MLSFRFLLCFGDFCPGILQRYGAIEHKFILGRIGIDTEVAQAFELESCAGGGIFQAGFDKAFG